MMLWIASLGTFASSAVATEWPVTIRLPDHTIVFEADDENLLIQVDENVPLRIPLSASTGQLTHLGGGTLQRYSASLNCDCVLQFGIWQIDDGALPITISAAFTPLELPRTSVVHEHPGGYFVGTEIGGALPEPCGGWGQTNPQNLFGNPGFPGNHPLNPDRPHGGPGGDGAGPWGYAGDGGTGAPGGNGGDGGDGSGSGTGGRGGKAGTGGGHDGEPGADGGADVHAAPEDAMREFRRASAALREQQESR